MPIVIRPDLPLVAAQGVAAPVVLQPGSVISARVQQIFGNDTARIVIGGQALDVQSQVPLQAGERLQLSVSQSPDGGIALAVVNQQGGAPTSQSPTNSPGATALTDSVTLAPDAAAAFSVQTAPAAIDAKVQLTAPQALAVSVAAQSAAAQQTSLAQLFANLSIAAGLDSLPPQVQQAVAQVLAQRTPLDSGLTGSAINQAFQSSGLFLEASLASGSLSPSAAPPDLKAALIVLRQVLSTSLSTAPVTPGASAAQSAATLSVPASSVIYSQGAAPAAAAAPTTAAQQGATTAAAQQEGTTTAAAPGAATTPAAAQQVATPVAAAESASTPAGVVPQEVVPSAAVAPEPPALSASLEQGAQPAIEILSPPVTITAEPATPTAVTPALVETATAAVSAQATATAGSAPNVVSVANQLVAPASAALDALSRAAVTSAALNLLQEVPQTAPTMATNPIGLLLENSEVLSLIPAVAGARSPEGDDIELARSSVPPPPLGGALPAAQPVLPATLLSNSSAERAMQRLLADTDGAIARQTLLQVASLPGQTDTAAARLDPTSPRWNFEIPFATPQGTAMAQFEISRDGGGNPVDAAKRVWRARFSLDVEPAGPVHALVSLSGDRTSVRIWAERPATAARLRAGAAQLSQALSRAELRPGDIVVGEGMPAQSAPARAGHFLDRAL